MNIKLIRFLNVKINTESDDLNTLIKEYKNYIHFFEPYTLFKEI